MLIELIDVRQALDRDELVPCFQPIVDLRTGGSAGFEVLARWQHPEHGLVLPENLFSLAEENGLMGRVTKAVLHKAFAAASGLSCPLSVNISPTQLHSRTLADRLRALAEAHDFPLRQLTIELTEHALLPNLALAQETAGELKALGCKLALDDFGTGYSGLFHLQALPFDELKIDASFVRTMTSFRESRKIVAAIVGLGYSLELLTVAEGVETEEEAELLLRLGCELGQGWLYGRPQSAERLPALLAGRPDSKLFRPQSLEAGHRGLSLEALPAQRLLQLEAIYDGAPVGLCLLDRNLRYVSLNRRLAELHGAPIGAHLGRTVEQMNPELYRRSEPYLRRALGGQATTCVEMPRPGPPPETGDRSILLSYQPVRDEAGEVLGVSVAAMDVTERARIEAVLRDEKEQLAAELARTRLELAALQAMP